MTNMKYVSFNNTKKVISEWQQDSKGIVTVQATTEWRNEDNLTENYTEEICGYYHSASESIDDGINPDGSLTKTINSAMLGTEHHSNNRYAVVFKVYISDFDSEIAKGDEKRKNIGAGKNIWDANGMYYWVMTQALWNPYQDVGTLRNEYLKRVYGPAADDMRRYFKEMEAAWTATDEPVLWNTDTQKSWNTFLKRGGLARCRQFLKQAEMKSLSPLGRKMLKRVAAGLNENPHVRLYEISEKLLSDYKANPKRYKNLAVNSGFEKRSDVYRKNHLDWTGSGVQNWGFWRAFKEGAYGPVEFEGRKESDCVYIHAPTTNACYLYDLLITGKLQTHHTLFSSRLIGVRAELMENEYLLQPLKERKNI